MRSFLLTAADLNIVFPPVRNFDYFQWDCVAGDPFPLTLTAPATFNGIAGKPVIRMTENLTSTFISRFFPYKGPNNTDGVYHPITVTMLLYVSGTGTFDRALLVDPNNGAFTKVNIVKTAGGWSIDNIDSSSPALLLDTWYRITIVYKPGVSISLYYSLEASLIRSLVGTKFDTTFTTTAPHLLMQHNIPAVGTSAINMADVRWTYATTG